MLKLLGQLQDRQQSLQENFNPVASGAIAQLFHVYILNAREAIDFFFPRDSES